MTKNTSHGALFVVFLLSIQVGLAQEPNGQGSFGVNRLGLHSSMDPRSTYEKILPLAEAGDPDMQNVLGFMYFYAEGVGLDYDQAHQWFHQAAEQGNPMAQRNLGLLHSSSRPRIPASYYDPVEANYWFSLNAAGASGGSRLAASSYSSFLKSVTEIGEVNYQTNSGEDIYLTFCAGCHGFDSSAPYPRAPSLLMGETLGKSDAALLGSILDGLNTMPAWRKSITEQQAMAVLAYVRDRFDESRDSGPAGNMGQANTISRASGDKDMGEVVYTQFCGGCHGFNGISYYVNSPSFALRQRMEKSDAQLSNSIRKGRGVMPSWENMLNPQQIDSLVHFIRTLAPAYESGIDHDIRLAPELYFLFPPVGEAEDNWHIRRDN